MAEVCVQCDGATPTRAPAPAIPTGGIAAGKGTFLQSEAPAGAGAARSTNRRAQVEEGQVPKRVIMYTTSWCPDCRVAKRYLDGRGVAYEEVNIEQTPGAAEQVERWSGGYRTVPTFDIDGQVVVDFDRAALDKALAQ